MKRNRILMAMLLSIGAVLIFSGCVEHRYYHENHHHSRVYYEHRHMPPPAGVEFEIHN